MRVQIFPQSDHDQVQFKDISGITERELFQHLQHLVGGNIEEVHTHRMDMKQNVLLVDEDARAKQRQPNFRATSQLGYPTLLLGTVVVVGEYYDTSAEEGPLKRWGDVHE